MAPDGKSFVYTTAKYRNDLWMLARLPTARLAGPDWQSPKLDISECLFSEGAFRLTHQTIMTSEENVRTIRLFRPFRVFCVANRMLFTPHKAVILPAPACRGRACDFFDLFVFFAPDKMLFNPSRKASSCLPRLAVGEPVTFSIFSCFLHPTRCCLVPPERRHPERSASQIYRTTEGLWRGVEGPRRCLRAGALRSFPATDHRGI